MVKRMPFKLNFIYVMSFLGEIFGSAYIVIGNLIFDTRSPDWLAVATLLCAVIWIYASYVRRKLKGLGYE